MAGTTGWTLGAIARRAVLPTAAIAVAAAIFGLPHLRAIESNRAAAYVADPMHCELELAPSWLGGAVESDLRDSFASLAPQTLRDESRLKLHLAGAEGKDAWNKLEPQLSQFEQRVGNVAEDKLEELRHAGSELKASVLKFYQGLRS